MNDNLKLVNQTLLVLDYDLDETVFEKLYERSKRKSILVQNAPLPCQSDMVHKTEPFFCHQRLRAMVPDIWENQQPKRFDLPNGNAQETERLQQCL